MDLYKLRRIHGNIHEEKERWNHFHRPFGKKVYFIGTPEYSNLGDSAIAIAERLFLEKYCYDNKRVKVFTRSEFNNNKNYFCKHINKKHLICLIGGGNLGNQWYDEELFRYKILNSFPKNPIIVFPQTIYFTKDVQGEKALNNSVVYYNNHKDLLLVARESKSYCLLKEYYDNPKKILSPDIVLSTTMSDYGVENSVRNGALLVFRSDVEKSMTDHQRESIKSELKKNNISYSNTDMYAVCPINESNRLECVKSKMQEFASTELVITDRLHGMIFAAITGTPCIVFSNYNYKVKGTYEWIKYLSYIEYVEDLDKAKDLIPKMIKMKNCQFDNKPLLPYFEELAKAVKEYAD